MLLSLKRLLICFITLTLAVPVLAFPKFQGTKLPIPSDSKLLSAADPEMLKVVLALEVYQDSEKPWLYYYIPPFHIRQYTQGAASLMLHSEKIKYFAEAMRFMGARKNVSTEKNLTFKQDIKEAETYIIEAQAKLAEAMSGGNQDLISLYKEIVAERKSALADLKIAIVEERENLIKNQDELASLNLAFMGHDVDISQCKDSEARIVALKKGASDASISYGGYLSFNTYAGFTKQQLDALRTYKARFMPHIDVALMPLEELTIKPLTETQYDSHLGSRSSKMFTQVKGSGDYLGTTIVMDTTVAGGMGMATHLPPFIVPVGIKATFKRQLGAFDATLKCDFSNGFRQQGRADVKDGLVIYDNDVTNTMKAEDFSNGACFLDYISGDKSSAEYIAMEELQKELEKIHMHKTELSYIEKHRYYQGVLADIEKNRPSSSSSSTESIAGTAGWLAVLSSLGLPGLGVALLSEASGFHWHTNIQDVENITKFKYEKRFKQGDTHKSVKRDLPVNFCLVYNISSKAYDRCTEEEFKKAEGMRDAMKGVQNSDECKDAKDIWECATRRDAAGLLPSRDPNAYQARDTMLVTNI